MMTRAASKTALPLPISADLDPRWRAVVQRDRGADGRFVYAVKTTGIYCRPSCASRLARPENVGFYDTAFAAAQAGFRACKRCQPDQLQRPGGGAERIVEICRWIEAAETPPRLKDLAARAGLSPFHLQRLFKATTGVTPKAYAAAQRARRVRTALLESGATVTDAIYDAGFNSSGRFYEASHKVLGMTPSDFRAGGANTAIQFAIGQCTLGAILVARSPRGVCAILIGDDPEVLAQDLQDRFPKAHLIGGEADFETWVAQVVGFVEAPAMGLDLPLDVRGTAFQQRVWRALQDIPPGTTASYTEIAQKIGAPKSVRAVAGACAANPIAVAIPCHRVVRNDGGLSGYRWGVERKRALLVAEADAKI